MVRPPPMPTADVPLGTLGGEFFVTITSTVIEKGTDRVVHIWAKVDFDFQASKQSIVNLEK